MRWYLLSFCFLLHLQAVFAQQPATYDPEEHCYQLGEKLGAKDCKVLIGPFNVHQKLTVFQQKILPTLEVIKDGYLSVEKAEFPSITFPALKSIEYSGGHPLVSISSKRVGKTNQLYHLQFPNLTKLVSGNRYITNLIEIEMKSLVLSENEVQALCNVTNNTLKMDHYSGCNAPKVPPPTPLSERSFYTYQHLLVVELIVFLLGFLPFVCIRSWSIRAVNSLESMENTAVEDLLGIQKLLIIIKKRRYACEGYTTLEPTDSEMVDMMYVREESAYEKLDEEPCSAFHQQGVTLLDNVKTATAKKANTKK